MRRCPLSLRRSACVTMAAMLGLALAQSAHAAPTYYPSGPQTSVSRASVLAGGWEVCYIGTYDGTPTLSSITAACTGTHLMLAGGPLNGTTWTLLAAAPRADVLFNTGTSNITHNANGTEWYYATTYSVGFAKGGDAVFRYGCDQREENPTMRLCWHVHNGSLWVGYRLGTIYPAGGVTAASYQRAVLQPIGPPVNTVAPAITGTPVIGSTLSGSKGTWTSVSPITYAYQWQGCAADGSACADVSGETATTYLPRSADIGRTVRVRVTATTGPGALADGASATVAVTAPIAEPTPDPEPTPAPEPAQSPAPAPEVLVPVPSPSPQARISTGSDEILALRGGGLTVRCTLTGVTGACGIILRAQDADDRWVVIGSGKGAGSITVSLRPRGRRMLEAAGGLLPVRLRGGVAGVRDEETATLVTTHGTATIAGFATGSAELPSAGRSPLARLVRSLRAAPAKSVRCVGHASGFGPSSDAELEALALRRARAVCAHLRVNGVDAVFTLLTRADDRHTTSNLTPEGRRHNRRVQILYSR